MAPILLSGSQEVKPDTEYQIAPFLDDRLLT